MNQSFPDDHPLPPWYDEASAGKMDSPSATLDHVKA